MHLEVSESSHERRHLIAVGTSNTHAADQASRGSIYVFDLIRVIPEPGRPETDRRLKLVAREDVKGAVTALSEVGSQGFLLVAQGQKCMVRGLKEDGTLLPVAFLDMMCHVSVARCLPGTGLCLMGDAVKGVWFVGYMVCFCRLVFSLDILLLVTVLYISYLFAHRNSSLSLSPLLFEYNLIALSVSLPYSCKVVDVSRNEAARPELFKKEPRLMTNAGRALQNDGLR